MHINTTIRILNSANSGGLTSKMIFKVPLLKIFVKVPLTYSLIKDVEDNRLEISTSLYKGH